MTLIEIPQWGNTNLVEALWLLSGLVAFGCAGLRLHPLVIDYHLASASGANDLHVIARGYMRREVIRLVQATFVIAIGAYAAHEPSVIPGPAKVSITGLILTVALISISFLVALQSVFDWRDREEVKRLLEIP